MWDGLNDALNKLNENNSLHKVNEGCSKEIRPSGMPLKEPMEEERRK